MYEKKIKIKVCKIVFIVFFLVYNSEIILFELGLARTYLVIQSGQQLHCFVCGGLTKSSSSVKLTQMLLIKNWGNASFTNGQLGSRRA